MFRLNRARQLRRVVSSRAGLTHQSPLLQHKSPFSSSKPSSTTATNETPKETLQNDIISASSLHEDQLEEEKKQSGTIDSKMIYRLLSGEPWMVGKYMLALGVSTAVSLSLPMALQDIAALSSAVNDPLLNQQAYQLMAKWGAIIGVGSISSYWRRFLVTDLAARIGTRLRQNFFNEIMKKDMNFFNRHSSGNLVHKLSNDITNISNMVTNDVSYGLRSLFMFMGGSAYIMYVCPSLALVSMPSMIFLGFIVRHIAKKLKYLRRVEADILSQSSNVANERWSQMLTVKLFNSEQKDLLIYKQRVLDAYAKSLQVNKLSSFQFGSVEFFGQMSIIGVLTFGAYQAALGAIPAHVLSSFAMYSLYLGMGFRGVTSAFTELKKAAGIYEELQHFCNNKLNDGYTTAEVKQYFERPDISKSHALYRQREYEEPQSIELRNVSYSYGEQTILENVSLKIERGQKVGIVGRSGNGKSTILHLLTNIYNSHSGEILIGDKTIEEIGDFSLRQSISVVNQNPSLFAMSVLDNIKLARPDATQEEVEEASRIAHAGEFITRLENRYETELGENAFTLSGGQRQRLAIARALLKNSGIILFDEATSSLDALSEKVIEKALKDYWRSKTAVVVSHQRALLREMDVIYRLEDHVLKPISLDQVGFSDK